MNSRHVIGTITIIGIVGFTIYAIKKSKDLKKAEENSFGVEDAKQFVQEYEENDAQLDREFHERMEEERISDIKNDAHDEVGYNQSFGVDYHGNSIAERIDAELPYKEEHLKKDFFEDDKSSEEDMKMGSRVEAVIASYKETVEEPEEEEEDLYDIDPSDQIFLSYKEPKVNPEEMEVLRHDPNSPEALEQFIRMELADWREDHPTFQTMYSLYKKEFVPRTDGDQILKTKLIDYRIGFFTHKSIHTLDITMADVITHYARAAQYNIGETVGYWVDYFLGFNELYPEQDEMELSDTIYELNSHAYFNAHHQTHGLFGLTPERFNEAERIASFSVHGEVTYETEFNEFLKACL